MIFVVKRLAVLVVLMLSVLQCTLLVGEFKDCEAHIDCWEAYDRNDLICRDSQCIIHELQPQCNLVVGDTDESKHDQEVLTFGAIMAMTDAETGESNPRGSFRSKAMALAYDYFNERGGVEGQNFRVRICDHQKDSSRVEALAKYLIEERGLPLVVTGGSSDTINASQVGIPAEALVMSISATALDISNLDDDGLVWRVVPSDAQIGRAVADSIEVVEGEPVPKAGVIYVNDPFGQGLSFEFSKRYKELHPSAEVSMAPFDEGVEESIMAALSSANTNMAAASEESDSVSRNKLFVIAFAQDAALIANQIGGSDYPNLPTGCNVTFADSMKDQAFLKGLSSTAPSVLEGASIPIWGASGSVYDTFRGAFETTYQLDPSEQGYLAHAYDLAFVSALASMHSTSQNGTVTGKGLAEGMRHLSSGEAHELEASNITAMINALKADGEIDVYGATGEINFDAEVGEPLSGQITFSYIVGGAFVESDAAPDACLDGDDE